jgi:ribosomal protein L16 Arg81 hydroxylase
MLQFPAPLTASSFLAQHWQKAPLFMPGALPLMEPAIGADDLAWLATQPDV